MKVEFDIASDQIDGARDYQEDAYMVNQLGEADNGDICSLIIMADGMGGHAAGNVASNMVVATFNKTFQGSFPTTEVAEVLTDALNRSNDQIRASVKETPALRGMGCTMVTAYVQDSNLYWVSVGDSHLYLIRDRELIKQNADHSYGAYLDMMKEQGMEIDEQAGMSRNMLMSAMTGEEISSIDVSETPIKLRPGDRVIVASDGLDTLGAGAIIQYSSWSSTAKECVYALLKAVEDANKINQDNTTLIVIDVKEREARYERNAEQAEPAPAQEPVARVAEVRFPGEPREPRSYKWLVWLIVLGLLGGGGYFAWEKGFVDEAVEKGTEIVETTTQKIEAELEAKLEPVFEPEPEPEPVAEPEPAVEPEPKPVYVDKADVFRDRLKSGGHGPTMIKIPAGRFRMGGASSLVAQDEVPRHQVNVASFMVSVYEITFAEYYRFASATGRKKPKSNGWDIKTHPVINVSWDDANAYTRWLAKETGKKYRLLSEAEWEYAGRAGTTSSFWWGLKPGAGNAHCFDCKSDFSTSKPAKVGTYKSNAFGLYDTAGNVFEWVHDCYHSNYNDAPADGSVWEGGDCNVRVVRGGAYGSPASSMRVENREKFKSEKGHYNVGIRVARDL
ncbi:MAG: SUMF1/EgtB/PvdO family nonheme iron enzyme [Gammaproteobacteria bacterium]|nr:SUMF1/EgtB/PvdO family nonheme iron enzyme [Gammaproteobacteria bacterium]MDH3857103.1 SUMF1/EgtB/PvdO family nonheme iron enzyme [Gammaproteobacteria bacterium]